MKRQLAFNLPFRPALGDADFLVSPSNQDAVLWLDRWPDWPSHALALHGPAGCGKTHLAHVFCARTRATLLDAQDLTQERVPSLALAGGCVAVENTDHGMDETALFHLFNALKEAGGFLLLTGREAPARWSLSLPDLRSRLNATPTAFLAEPDDALMGAVLIKLFADRQISVEVEVITYLLRHMERSFAAAQEVVARADALALAEKRGVTVPLIKRAL
ncbi:MAG: hypothetical protein A2516_05470 [Alphaproteobacteria bacterium RIFOXYD12_FULL_60_8]|nr:MAG: hypothetical protein A2516_05470 [Alphaproteobacteria bacterium RIFOXYD12_FULL_60_8]